MPESENSADVGGSIKSTILLLRTYGARYVNHIVLMLIGQLVLAHLELLSIASLVPLLTTVLGDSDRPAYVVAIQKYFALSNDELVFYSSLIFAIAIMVVNIVRLVNVWYQQWLTARIGNAISSGFFDCTLALGYLYNVQVGSDAMFSRVIHDLNTSLSSISSMFSLSLSIILCGTILAGIIWIEPEASLAIIAVGLIFYYFADRVLGRPMISLGEKRSTEFRRLLRVMREAYANIIDVILTNSRNQFTRKFAESDSIYRSSSAIVGVMRAAPRYFLEFGMALFVVLFILYLNATDRPLVNVFSTIGVIAFAFTRVIPAVQQAYAALSGFRSSQVSLRRVRKIMERNKGVVIVTAPDSPLELRERLEVQDIWYRYPSNIEEFLPKIDRPNLAHKWGDSWILKGASITVPAGKITAITGKSGSGKSTLANIVATLLTPDSGSLSVDGKQLDEEGIRNWRMSVAYVPQMIHLLDASIAENIAFTIDDESIDMEKIKAAAACAKVDEFIDRLPNRYSERVGQDGVKLSGGQRQRIAIARAMYRDAQLIILDEASSSLDNETERGIMRAIYALRGSVAVLVIAHRLSTIQQSDTIHFIDEGKVIANGTFVELMANSPPFRKLIEAGSFVGDQTSTGDD